MTRGSGTRGEAGKLLGLTAARVFENIRIIGCWSSASPRSNIDALHGFLRIARARGGSARRSTVQAGEIVRAQFHLHSADVLLEIVPAFRARDGHNIIATSQKPRQRKLRRRAVLFRSEFLD